MTGQRALAAWLAAGLATALGIGATNGRPALASAVAVAPGSAGTDVGISATNPNTAQRPPVPTARPSSSLVARVLHYNAPVTLPDGSVAHFAPLGRAVVSAALADVAYLDYRYRSDLGGFLPAPVGGSAFTTGGRGLVGAPLPPHQIPTYAHAGSGRVTVFAAVGALPPNTPADNGLAPVPGLGIPPPALPPTAPGATTLPPFSPNPPPSSAPTTLPPATVAPTTTTAERGTPSTLGPPVPASPTTTAPRRRSHPTTTTAPRRPTTTTTPPTTTTRPGRASTTTTTAPRRPTTTTAPPGSTTTTIVVPVPPTTGSTTTTTTSTTTTLPPTGTDCSPVVDFVETGDHPGCRLTATGMVPGEKASEEISITNETGAPFALSLRVKGAAANALWSAVRLTVTDASSGIVLAPARTLSAWTGSPASIVRLASKATIHLEIDLELPRSAGNVYQGLTATFDLVWRAQG